MKVAVIKENIMSIGLKRGTVAVEPHSVTWEISAQEVIHKIKDILRNDIIDIQHIGSTSVKSICAKPIVDIVVGVSDFQKMFNHNEELSNIGIFYRGEDYPGQLLYACGDLENNLQTHFVHVVIYGSEKWTNYINMRDYLNSHEDVAKKYDELKKSLAIKYPEDRIAYTDAKSELIEEILQSAKEWREKLTS